MMHLPTLPYHTPGILCTSNLYAFLYKVEGLSRCRIHLKLPFIFLSFEAPRILTVFLSLYYIFIREIRRNRGQVF